MAILPLPLDEFTRDVELFTFDEVATLWRCSRRSVDRMVAAGTLRWVPIFSERRIPATELRAYIARHLAHPPIAPPRQLRRPRSA